MTEKTTASHPGDRTIEWGAGTGATTEFERLYRANVDAVTAYFARRAADPQVVADLTADTFVAAITSFKSFDPRKGTGRAWVFGIARRVYASYCETYSQHQHRLQRLAGRRELDPDQVEELLASEGYFFHGGTGVFGLNLVKKSVPPKSVACGIWRVSRQASRRAG